MPIPILAQTQPAASFADAARERAILARLWPAALRDVLLVAARVDRFNGRAVALGVAPIAEPSVAAVGALWTGLLDGE